MKPEDFELTHEQIKACNRIERAIKNAQEKGLRIYGESDHLVAYQNRAWELGLVAEQHLPSSLIPVPSRIVCSITDSKADDPEYFK